VPLREEKSPPPAHGGQAEGGRYKRKSRSPVRHGGRGMTVLAVRRILFFGLGDFAGLHAASPGRKRGKMRAL